MKRSFMSILLAMALAVGNAAPAYAGEVITLRRCRKAAAKQRNRARQSGRPQKQSSKNPMAMNGLPLNRSVDLDAYAQEVLTLANAQREAAGLNPLSADPVLTEMAMLRARELEESYSHTRPSGGELQNGVRGV